LHRLDEGKMRFSLQDVQKQVRRRGDELYVSLHFLRPDELHPEIERLIAYHEQMLGQPRRLFVMDEARAAVADYRLAHCLICVLSAWYSWRQCPWLEVLEGMGLEAHKCLEEAGITSPVQLRLALFSYVNECYAGFLDAATRPQALQTFAAAYRLSVGELEYLLALDSDEEGILVRATPQAPTAQEVATLYNQWAFEAALFSASKVSFVIDSRVFEQVTTTAMTGTGVGAVIKRLCYLARRLGVYYDLTCTSDEMLGRVPARDTSSSSYLHLTLYGPQEMTGAPQQYGLRLARLCRLLLGYGVKSQPQRRDLAGQSKQKKGAMQARGRNELRPYMLPSAIVEAEATVHFLQRSYCFEIDTAMLTLLPPVETSLVHAQDDSQTQSAKVPLEDVAVAAPSSVFDSSIEQSFAEAFAALEQSQAVDGWRLLREPEPLLLDSSIFIPDFLLTRGQQRIYVEILGFWTPSYRERKLQKLQQLQERKDIVLAIPRDAREAFASIASAFPIVEYDGQLSATELLQTLRNYYDDFEERLAAIDRVEVRQAIERKGLVPERGCYELLHCYRRSELVQAAAQVTGDGIAFRAGVGLYLEDWMEQLKISFVEWIERIGSLSLLEVLRESRVRWPVLNGCEDATLEAILALWPEVRIQRASIFEAVVEVAKHKVREDAVSANGEVLSNTPASDHSAHNTPTKKSVRERSTTPKKRVVREVAQGDLWG
jgi:predicted nuclease of restriction endonuclease-like RecB superfamily